MIAEAEWVGISIVVNRNGGDSRSGGEPHVSNVGAETSVRMAEATNNNVGEQGPPKSRQVMRMIEDNEEEEKRESKEDSTNHRQ